MGQRYSSTSSLRSRQSEESSSVVVQEFSSVVNFAHASSSNEITTREQQRRRSSGAFAQDFYKAREAVQRTFRRIVENGRKGKKKKRTKKKKIRKRLTSASIAMASALYTITDSDIRGIQLAWTKIEPHLLPIGIRMFISILESRCEKMPVCKQKACCNNSESKKTQCCPTQVMLNEELQKFVLLLMGIIRRCVKHISSQVHVVKLLKKCSRKHFRKLNFDLTKLDPDPLAKHFCHSVREIITTSTSWNHETELAYTNLIRMIVKATQKLSQCTALEYAEGASENDLEDDDDDSDSEEDTDSESASGSFPPASPGLTPTPTFDRQLVMHGCQTFQDFFELHPNILLQFDRYKEIFVEETMSAAEALKMHASKVLALTGDLSKNSGNPDKIKSMMHDLAKHHKQKGLREENWNVLGPIICHTIRPVVFKSGLWSIEVEKSWTHLFDMVTLLMRQNLNESGGARGASARGATSLDTKKTPFPSLTQIIILKDTWSGIVEHMHQLGLTAVVKLFKINYNFKFYTSPKVRYRPQTKAKDDPENLNVVFNLIISIVDQLIASMPTRPFPNGSKVGSFTDSAAILKQMDQLREPLDWIGPVFCNTVRPLLLVQGKWSYQVETSWLLLFKNVVKNRHTTERLMRRERFSN